MNSNGLSIQFLFVTSTIILQWFDNQVYTFYPSCKSRHPRNQNPSTVCVNSSSNLLHFSAWRKNDQILIFIRPVKKVPSQENKNNLLITELSQRQNKKDKKRSSEKLRKFLIQYCVYIWVFCVIYQTCPRYDHFGLTGTSHFISSWKWRQYFLRKQW